MSVDPLFLDVHDVMALHAAQLEVFGGGNGMRELGLLESAVAQPQASFDGHFVHEGLLAMAGAYLFHIVSNHPFVDGNKRAGVLAALVFLDVNGMAIDHPSEALYALTMRVAEGSIPKAAVVTELERIAVSR
ncbi:MAG: type II toxin-antitoxin system death-on-curing family toxin [Deltaproteobacteria bacterium]|nr:type II toxin-antitoxin system death-on-curing family toxin [Deltaproteobacteria bacterium]